MGSRQSLIPIFEMIEKYLKIIMGTWEQPVGKNTSIKMRIPLAMRANCDSSRERATGKTTTSGIPSNELKME